MTYLKGKDIKQQGDCLVYCYTRKIEVSMLWNDKAHYETKPPEDFEKW